MDRLAYTAMTAANRTLESLSVRANNLANANTPGFRADMESAQAVDIKGYGYDSRHLATVKNDGVDMTPGTLTVTGRDLDFAIRGQGLIALQDGNGEAYTRHGSMVVDSEGRLTINGRQVMGEGGPIVLPEYDNVSIGEDGTISVMPRGDYLMTEVDKIKLVDAPAAELKKNAAGLLVRKDGQPAQAADNVRLVSGYLESSNVSSIDQLTATLSLNRTFETQVKMMKAAEDMASAGDRLLRD
ncbi:Flagellar basal-body rod protein flgG [Pseudomonas knackmussii B13]|uniref:Flagellar basal-body rod protein FlgF n=1 Tax=Pseudomonas knackmussii (strain DSM 6978 / CCUG 54928 / LMG 23759 / B13) TaxID=1301098 RepID=A0A024HGX3_PSEKB|nr:flagellar basal-body rod protein FlgF [Pseudomonas knackmussii]CDF83899.1 Flagellar basal-body rod protein flgG [Pseudomonas knackmussii B13]